LPLIGSITMKIIITPILTNFRSVESLYHPQAKCVFKWRYHFRKKLYIGFQGLLQLKFHKVIGIIPVRPPGIPDLIYLISKLQLSEATFFNFHE
jgi:hypothetical protein